MPAAERPQPERRLIYRESLPCPPLAAYVRCLWTLETSSVAPIAPVFPDGSMELVFHLDEPFTQIAASGAGVPQPPSFLVGQMCQPLLLRPGRRSRVIGVRFVPGGAYPFLRFPQTEATGQLIPLDAVWGPAIERLHEQLCLAPPDQAWAQVEAFLLAHCDLRASAAFHQLTHQRVGDRQQRRRFRQIVGLNPRDLAALRRFQRALRCIPRLDLPEAAGACGYYDQSHMALEFRRFAGVTPSAWRREQLALTASFVSESS